MNIYSVLSEHCVESSFTSVTTDHIWGMPLPALDIYKLKTFHLYKIIQAQSDWIDVDRKICS